MRIANHRGRLVVVRDETFTDVEQASNGLFSSDPQEVYERWDDFRAWYDEAESTLSWATIADGAVEAVVPRPRQVFAIGLNYRSHAEESGFAVPESPATFTKFPSCLAGAYDDIPLPSDNVDWEVELVAVIGRRADFVSREDAWQHVAGLTIGQDLSERVVQKAGPAPQFSLGKSFRGFGPIGPEVVTIDELDNPDDLALTCQIDGETMQKGRTNDLVFSVPELIARLSAVCPLLPGDLIFTGTPSGVGGARNPKVFLRLGQQLVSTIDGIGSMKQKTVAAVEGA